MKCIDRIQIHGGTGVRTIELLVGDLATIPHEHRVDVLAVSAFPSDYTPTPNSLIGALHRAGVSVAQLSYDKAEDLRDDFGCWLSQQLNAPGFDRLLCFEPAIRGLPHEVVGDFFRCIAALAGAALPLRSVAIPLFAAGEQAYPAPVMAACILHAAILQMASDLPLDRLKIVALPSVIGSIADVFREIRSAVSPTAPRVDTSDDVDLVLTAAPGDHEYADIAVGVINTVAPDLRVYRSPPVTNFPGYERLHYTRLDRCRRAIALITPAFIQSKLCQDDLYIARFRAQQSLAPLLFPVLLRNTDLPPSLRVLRMVDCRDNTTRNLRMVSAMLAIQVQEVRGARHEPDPSDETTSTLLAISTFARALGSPVLGSCRRYSDAGTPGSVSRQSLVLELCQSLFALEEFKILLRHLPHGDELVKSLPGEAASSSVFFDAAIESLARRGMIGEHFFAVLRDHRPYRMEDIQRIAVEWELLGTQVS